MKLGILQVVPCLMLLCVHTLQQAPSSNCDSHNAICLFNGRLKGTILFHEKRGFGCRNYGDDEDLHIDIHLQGFDPQDRVTSHNFRVKSFAGVFPNCSGMGPDFGQGLRGADLGTFPEGAGGVLHVSDVRVQQGPWLSGQQSVVGRSVAVIQGRVQQQTPEVLDCSIIGMVNHPQRPTVNTRPSFTNSFNTPTSSQPTRPLGNSGIRRQSSATRPSTSSSTPFGSSAFRSPFSLGDKLSFFDLSGKTARVTSFLPDSVQQKFKAPEPPRFQDIYGLDSGDSPLARSGYGNTVGPSKGSALSRMFFQDQDIKSTIGFGLSADEKDIPRESGDEESTRSFHEDKPVDREPIYEDSPDYRGETTKNEAQDDPEDAAETVQPGGSASSEYGSSDVSEASFLPENADALEDIDISQEVHNGLLVKNATEDTDKTQ